MAIIAKKANEIIEGDRIDFLPGLTTPLVVTRVCAIQNLKKHYILIETNNDKDPLKWSSNTVFAVHTDD